MSQKGLPLRTFAIFLLAAVIGVAGGVLGSFFQIGLNWLQERLTGGSGAGMSEAVRANLSWWQTLLVPTVGGLAAGTVLLLLRGHHPPFGISDLVGLVQLARRHGSEGGLGGSVGHGVARVGGSGGQDLQRDGALSAPLRGPLAPVALEAVIDAGGLEVGDVDIPVLVVGDLAGHESGTAKLRRGDHGVARAAAAGVACA